MKNFLKKLFGYGKQSKNYARVVGVVLFVLGFSGFIFRSSDSLPDIYLLFFLVVGFWGIVISISETR